MTRPPATTASQQHSFTLLRWGALLFAFGAAGDLAYHAVPAHMAAHLAWLLGAEAHRAHLLTLLGMTIVVTSLLWKGLSHVAR